MLMHVISIWIRRSEPEILLKITITPIRFTFPFLYLLSSLIACLLKQQSRSNIRSVLSNTPEQLILNHVDVRLYMMYVMHTQKINVYRSFPYCQYLFTCVYLRNETPPRAQTHEKSLTKILFCVFTYINCTCVLV